MFNRKTDTETLTIQDMIDVALAELSAYTAEDAEYDTILEKIERLNKLKDPNLVRKPISYDTILLASANIAGIALILSYEHFVPLTSKALGFVTKLRL